MKSELREQINFYEEFKPWYDQIIKDFKFEYKKDCESRDLFSKILLNKGKEWDVEQILESFKKRILEKSPIFVYGCGPSLESTVDYLSTEIEQDFFKKIINLAADGASVLLRQKQISVDAIFTDLDGITKKEFYYSDFNIVHAHGDNIDNIQDFKEDIIKFQNIIGTTQVEPIFNVINPGGFTDGDRILFFLRSLLQPHHQVYLIGMDFSEIVGKYSKPSFTKDQKGGSIKKKKLKYAVELLEWLFKDLENKIYFINSKKVSDKFNYISLDDVSNFLPF